MLDSGLATVAAANKAIELKVTAIVLLLVGSCLIIPSMAGAQCTPELTTVLKGTVFLESPNKPDYVPGATVIIQADTMTLSAVTDRDGRFRFSNMEPGTYTVEATFFSLHAEQKISVEPGTEVQVVLQLKLPDPTISANP